MNKNQIYYKILNVAESFLQKVGFNAFSYKDIAIEVEIKTSSIHYYFPTKSDLGKAVVARHTEQASEILANLLQDHKKNCKDKIDIYLETIFANTYHKQRKMCLGGMLAADVLTLEKAVQEEVKAFFDVNVHFLKDVLQEGKRKGEFSFQGGAHERAKSILAILEGALLFARLYQDESHLQGVKEQIFELLV